MSRMEALGLFKMRDGIGLFLVALDASEIPASKKFLSSPSQWPQSFFCKQNAMKDEEKLKLCEI